MTNREVDWINQQPAEKREKLVRAIEGMREVLAAFEPDINREGLVDTPLRYIKFLSEFIGIEFPQITQFKNDGSSEMIIVRAIPFFSLCEHHLAPFYGTVDVAYFPKNEIIGLSKIPRLVKWVTQGFQNQERITADIASFLEGSLQNNGVAVRVKAKHLCMAMRGVEKEAETITTKYIGDFHNEEQKRIFLSQI